MATATAATSVTVQMSLAKETKGTFVYHADAENAGVTQVYVRKDALPQGAPQVITLTIN